MELLDRIPEDFFREAMFPMYTFFSGKIDEEADTEIKQPRNVFEIHREYIGSGAETDF